MAATPALVAATVPSIDPVPGEAAGGVHSPDLEAREDGKQVRAPGANATFGATIVGVRLEPNSSSAACPAAPR